MASTTRDYTILLTMRADLRDALGKINQVDSAVGGLKGTIVGLAGALGIGFSIAGIVDFVKQTIEADQQLGNMSKTLGISTEMLSALDQEAKKAGISIEDVQTSLVQLSRAETGQNQSGGRALQAMGINAKDAAGNLKPLPTLLQEVSSKFNSYAEGPAKAALATALFGKSGAQLIPLLDQLGQEGLQNLTDKAIAAGTAVGTDAVNASQKFGDAMDTLKAKLQGAVNQGLQQFTPEIEDLAKEIDDPKFQQALIDTANAIAQIAKASIDAAAKLAEFTRGYAEFVAKSQNGAGGFDLEGLQNEQSNIEDELKQRQQSPILSGLNSFLAGTENNIVQNAVEGGRPRIQSMSTSELQSRLAQIQSQINALKAQPKNTPNPQEGDQRGVGKGAGTSQAPIVPPKAIDHTQALTAATLQLQNTLANLQARVAGPITAAWIQYNKTVDDAQVQTQKIITLGGDATKANAQLAAITKAAAAARDQAIKLATDNLQSEFLQATGHTGAAAAIQITDQWQRMLDDLTARSDTAGVAMVKKLINVEEAQAQLQELQQKFSVLDNIYSTQAQAVNADQGAGLISQLDARQKLLDLNQQQADALEKLLPLMREQAQLTGNPQDQVNVANVEEKIRELRLQTSALGEAVRNEVMGDFDQLFTNLLSGTESVKQAFSDFFLSVGIGLAKMALNELAQKAIGGLLSKIGGGSQGADVSAGATKLTVASGILAAGSALLGTNAVKLQAAATTLAAANGLGIVAGHAGGGLILGPGTSTSDSIPARLSTGEFVMKADAVKHYGVGIMAQMNTMKFAGGGFVHPLANAPTPAQLGFAQPGRIRPNLPATNDDGRSRPAIGLRIINGVDQQFVHDAMSSSAGETVIMNTIGRNQVKLKQMVR